MRVLSFIVNEQQIKKDPRCNFSQISPNTSGYLKAKFTFGKGWSGCKIAASFWCLGKEYPALVGHDGTCIIPDQALTWDNFKVSLTRIKEGYKITTNKIIVEQEG